MHAMDGWVSMMVIHDIRRSRRFGIPLRKFRQSPFFTQFCYCNFFLRYLNLCVHPTWNSLGCSILCIHSIPFPSDETRVCVRAPSPLSLSNPKKPPSSSLAFGGGGNHFRSGEFGQSSSGLRATYRGRGQFFP